MITDTFKRIAEFRKATGRDIATGYKNRPMTRHGISMDDIGIIRAALRVAASTNRRDDLRLEYHRLAKEVESVMCALKSDR